MPHPGESIRQQLYGLTQNCKVKAVIASAPVFSDNDKNKWREYASPKHVPYREDWSETAYVWGTPNAPVVIALEAGGEDFDESTYYCFDASGRLSIVELRISHCVGMGVRRTRAV
jgi:hypothetical protein